MTQPSDEQLSEPVEPQRSYEDLPADFIFLLYNTLPVRDLVAASCACKQWLRCSERVWESRVRRRWLHWKTPLPPSSSSSMGPKGWRDLYRLRHERDASVFSLLQDACWPVKQEAVYAALMEMGADAVDALAAAAHSGGVSSMFLGVTYHAHVALHFVVGELSAVQLRQLLQERLPVGNADVGSSSSSAAPAAAAAAAGGTADLGGGSSSSSSSDGEGRHADDAAAAASCNSDVEASLEGALMLAQALHPLGDVAAVRRFVGQLGQELTRRMQQAGALPGSRQAVDLLNKLMFSPPSTSTPPKTATPAASTSTLPGSSTAAAGSSAAAAAAPAGPSRAAAAAAVGDDVRFPWWRRNKELDGPELTGLAVPQGSSAGLGLQGNSSSYYATSNSCLDSVLANRAGLPISLALLHAAVGEAAGLTVQLVGMPGHVITRALVKAPGSKGLASTGVNPRGRGSNSGTAELAAGDVQGTSSSGPNDEESVEDEMGSWMYIDVFNGGAELGDADLRGLALRHNFPVDALQQLLQPMDAAATLRRMTLNLINSVRMGYAAHVGRLEMQRPPVHQLQLRSISVALLSLQLAAAFGSSIPARDAFDMGVQLSQLIGLGHTIGPPGGVLLMRKMAEVLPPALIGWKVKIEAGIQGEVEAKERQQQQRQDNPRLHSRHPSVHHRVGTAMHTEGGRRTATILAWQALEPRTPVQRVSGLEETEQGVDEVLAGARQTDRERQPLAAESVKYKLLLDNGTILDFDQPWHPVLSHVTREWLLEHQERQTADYSARQERCAAVCHEQLQHLKRCWFESDFPPGLLACGEGSWQTVLHQRWEDWPDRHLAHGQHFEAWVPDELWRPDLDYSPPGHGWYWLNANLRVEFPDG